MVQSMTGFGKAESEFSGRKISVEIKSLNSKQFDLLTRIPTAYRDRESEIRNILLAEIERGKVEIIVAADVEVRPGSLVNQSAVKAYYREFSAICDSLNLEVPPNWLSIVMRQPDAMKTDSGTTDEAEWANVKATLEKAIEALQSFRTQEGAMLEAVFREKISNIGRLLEDIEQYDPERTERMRSRLAESLLKHDIQGQIDENRFEQELIYYIERFDVSEEKSRLANHLRYFIETLENEHSQGRKLGFIAQEIGREINTLGSKSNHAEMQQTVVKMKDELEQIKEQVLNVL
jgi:uncharacterized protein (TIGR00255 family)